MLARKIMFLAGSAAVKEVRVENMAPHKREVRLFFRSQIDWQGGVLAANDSDIVHYNRDTYSYIWPRDVALVAHALDLSGHPAASRNIFRFIAQLLQPEGCLLHKFNPDGSLASSWHPWYHEGEAQLPIQGAVPCGVDLELFCRMNQSTARRHLGFNPDDTLALFVGRFDSMKGLDRMLEAMRYLKHRRHLRLIIVGGDGIHTSEGQTLLRLARTFGVEDSISFIGRIAQKDLSADAIRQTVQVFGWS